MSDPLQPTTVQTVRTNSWSDDIRTGKTSCRNSKSNDTLFDNVSEFPRCEPVII